MDAPFPASRAWRRIGEPLRWLYQTAAFYLVLTVCGVVFIGWNLPATALYWLLPRRRSVRVGQYMIMRGFRTLLGLLQVTGLARLDMSAIDTLRGQPGLVIASNHPTLLDAVLVTSRLPRIVCITKASLWDNPALGAGARLAGYIRNDAPFRVLRHATDSIHGGSQLLIFPEGTRTRTAPVGTFKPGFGLMARRAGAPVQTVFLHSSSPYVGKGWPIWRRPPFPLVYRARLGKRFIVEGSSERFAQTLEAYYRAELAHR